jgi:16S rRNA (uracil1498-N3)-methyltransferase
MRSGDAFEALDGAGSAWLGRVKAADRRGLSIELGELLRREPEPGESGSALPHVTVAAALPRLGHAEELVQCLSQLGARRWIPLVTRRSPPAGRELEGHRRERLERIAGEALKQSGGLWALEIAPPTPLQTLLATPFRRAVRCSPRADLRLCDFVTSNCYTTTWMLYFGPEGGFDPAEEQAFEDAGVPGVWLAPQILRIEVAVCAAVAVLVNRLARVDPAAAAPAD